MRFNRFKDPYCSSPADIDSAMAAMDIHYSDIHAEIYLDEHRPGKWAGEVRYNEDGEVAFYMEDFTEKAVLIDALVDVGLSRGDITET